MITEAQGVTKVAKCYTGLLHRPTPESRQLGGLYSHPEVLRRIAVATPRALEHLNSDITLLERLETSLADQDKIDLNIIREHGLWPISYQGHQNWITVGIRFFDPPAQETPLYLEAIKKVQDIAPGVHRSVYMAMHGVEARGINGVTAETYQAALGRLFRLFEDPKHQGLRILEIAQGLPFDLTENTNEGLVVRLSATQLESETYRAWPRLTEKPMRLIKVGGQWIMA